MMRINNEFLIGEIVFIKTDAEQLQRQVCGYEIYLNEIMYIIACGTVNSRHYAFELSREKNILINS